jgi:hypothetical protein
MKCIVLEKGKKPGKRESSERRNETVEGAKNKSCPC